MFGVCVSPCLAGGAQIAERTWTGVCAGICGWFLRHIKQAAGIHAHQQGDHDDDQTHPSPANGHSCSPTAPAPILDLRRIQAGIFIKSHVISADLSSLVRGKTLGMKSSP